MADAKPLDAKQLDAKRKQIEDKREELLKLENETQKYYLGRPVTIIAETHPSRQWTIRFDTGETESVQKHLVVDTPPEPAYPVESTEEPKAESNPVKEWFKK